jgi:uncharacterized protein YbcC (UPF0753/DUF2309 family)
MVHVSAEPIPYFWPMRTFIHHNPLYGLEHMEFSDALKMGAKLFHGRTFLPRSLYQNYLAQGKVDEATLAAAVSRFAADKTLSGSINLNDWLMTLLTRLDYPVALDNALATPDDVYRAIHEKDATVAQPEAALLTQRLRDTLLTDMPMYEVVDCLYGTAIGKELDELVIRSCLDFFDEGQSVWGMPERELGLFKAWRDVALRNLPFFLRGFHIRRILNNINTPEGIIAHVFEEFGIPESRWMAYMTRELARLHGWVGFIRWRSSARNYYWAQQYHGDLVDYLAIRMTLALALLNSRKFKHARHNVEAISAFIDNHPAEAWLRHELYSKKIVPAMALAVDRALASGKQKRIQAVYEQCALKKRESEMSRQLERLRVLEARAGADGVLQQLDPIALDKLLGFIREFESQEGMMWLQALESRAMNKLLQGLTPDEHGTDKRPFAQALFCIDVRSERIRRHLEAVGDYQTYGVAGFFGVPVSFMDLDKGSETHLCPVILTPKNLVPEITAAGPKDAAAITALDHALHTLKQTVLTPFVTVEAIGLLFGLDMVGKTIAPVTYNRWRKRLYEEKPATRLLLDKLNREQADSILRATQRAVIETALQQELKLSHDNVNDAIIRELRELAMGHQAKIETLVSGLHLNEAQLQKFIERLRTDYRISPDFSWRQMEQLSRIGFTLDEQKTYVSQALRSIGMTKKFSRFVLLVGHGSSSENNPYESALDCGACGGNHGLMSGRVLAQMANKPEVRRALRQDGVEIPDDTWFVPAFHNTTTDELQLLMLELLPPSHLVYLDRLRTGLKAAAHRCAQERMPTLEPAEKSIADPVRAYRHAQRQAMDWSQVRPEWGLAQNLYFIIGRRELTQRMSLEGRAFLHSYDYRIDPKQWLLVNILSGPLVVAQWINMEHYFSTVDNERFGSGSKVVHNVAGRFAVMTGNLSDLRTGLPAQTVLKDGMPYHEPIRLITLIEAPLDHVKAAVEGVAAVKRLVNNGWIRLMVVDPDTQIANVFESGQWRKLTLPSAEEKHLAAESVK